MVIDASSGIRLGYHPARPNSGIQLPLSSLDYLIVLVSVVVMPSAVLHSLLGIDERIAFGIFPPILFVAAFLGLGSLDKSTNKSFAVSCWILSISTAASFVADSFSQLLMGIVLIASVVIGRELSMTLHKDLALKLVSVFSLLLLISGVIGMVYFYSGGPPLLTIAVGYRKTSLYLSTFSFSYVGSFLRPSGIFDEPGSFVMFVSIVTMFNDAFKKNLYLNFILILLMVAIGSLAGLGLAGIYLCGSNATRFYRKRIFLFVSLLLVLYVGIYSESAGNTLSSGYDTFYGSRLEVVSGHLVGDNRSNQVGTFFKFVDGQMLRRGSSLVNNEYTNDDMSSNPFSIIFGYGLLISLPYFGLLIWLIWVTLKNGFRNSYVSIGLFVLLLQRPYLFNMSWSIMISAAAWLVHSVSGRAPANYLPSTRKPAHE